MKNKRRAIALLLAALFCFSAFGCAKEAETTAPAPASSGTADAAPAASDPVAESAALAELSSVLEHSTTPWYQGDINVYTSSDKSFVKKTAPDTVVIGSGASTINQCVPQRNTEYGYSYNIYECLLEYDRATGEVKGLLATDRCWK